MLNAALPGQRGETGRTRCQNSQIAAAATAPTPTLMMTGSGMPATDVVSGVERTVVAAGLGIGAGVPTTAGAATGVLTGELAGDAPAPWTVNVKVPSAASPSVTDAVCQYTVYTPGPSAGVSDTVTRRRSRSSRSSAASPWSTRSPVGPVTVRTRPVGLTSWLNVTASVAGAVGTTPSIGTFACSGSACARAVPAEAARPTSTAKRRLASSWAGCRPRRFMRRCRGVTGHTGASGVVETRFMASVLLDVVGTIGPVSGKAGSAAAGSRVRQLARAGRTPDRQGRAPAWLVGQPSCHCPAQRVRGDRLVAAVRSVGDAAASRGHGSCWRRHELSPQSWVIAAGVLRLGRRQRPTVPHVRLVRQRWSGAAPTGGTQRGSTAQRSQRWW